MSLFSRRSAKPRAKSKRSSDVTARERYRRKPLDQYETPYWATLALIPHLPEFISKIWEPACGNGKMVEALRQAGFDVVASDVTQGVDFLGRARRRVSARSSQITLCSGARIHRTRLAL
jgi:hypothetical protein